MKRLILILLAGLTAIIIFGCASTRVDLTGLRDGVYMTDPDQGLIIDHFTIEVKYWYCLYDLIILHSPVIDNAVAGEIAKSGGSAAVNVVITGAQEFFPDGIVSFLTARLLGARTVIVEGDIIQ